MSQRKLSRRDFLNLLAVIPASIAVQSLSKVLSTPAENQPHVIVIVYDAWSARNTSLYGYPRSTMPNLETFAQKANVYHQHHSTGTFTVPGTASILTGSHPWTHRALTLGGRISNKYQNKQIFNVFSDTHSTLGYAQNKYADLFLYQAGSSLKTHIPHNIFNLNRRLAYSLPVFKKDPYIAFSAIDETIFQKNEGLDGSLFFGPLFRNWTLRNRLLAQISHQGQYIDGLLPETTEQFLLKDVVDGAIETLRNLKEPSLVYIHFFPPHEPYCPPAEFVDIFAKGPETLIKKEFHPLSEKKEIHGYLKVKNQQYDEYLAGWDAEVARLYQMLDQSGLRDNSYIFITSDHGEMFERGELGHVTPLLTQPLTHVPLIVSYPGAQERKDIYLPTSSVDILPTITHLTGKTRPDWAEGQVLPGLGGQDDPQRSIFSMDAKKNTSFGPLVKFSLSLIKDNKRLVYYQYDSYKQFEFYDLAEDPEEMTDLYPTHTAIVANMEQELVQKIAEINAPYKR